MHHSNSIPYEPVSQSAIDISEDLLVNFQELKKALEVNNKEKAVAILASLLTALGVSAGFVIDTYWLLTSGVGEEGSGMDLHPKNEALSKLLVTIMGVASALLSIPLTCWIYGNYITSEQSLMKRIEDQCDLQIQLHKKLEEAQFNYFVELLRYRFLMEEKSQAAFQEQLKKYERINFTDSLLNLIEMVYQNLKKDSELKELLKQDIFENTHRENIKKKLQTWMTNLSQMLMDEVSQVESGSCSAAIKAWIIGFKGTFSSVLSASWGTSAIVMAGVPAVALRTAWVGWGLLSGTGLMSLGFANAYAYYKYKNTKRTATLGDLEKKMQEFISLKEEIEMNTNRIREQVRLRTQEYSLKEKEQLLKFFSQPKNDKEGTPQLSRRKSESDLRKRSLFHHESIRDDQSSKEKIKHTVFVSKTKN